MSSGWRAHVGDSPWPNPANVDKPDRIPLPSVGWFAAPTVPLCRSAVLMRKWLALSLVSSLFSFWSCAPGDGGTGGGAGTGGDNGDNGSGGQNGTGGAHGS